MQWKAVLVVVLMGVSGGVQAQDASRRMDPEVWFQQKNIADAFQFASDKAVALPALYRAHLSVGRDALVHGPGGDGAWLRDGDMRLVLDEAGVNLSRSHNIGFNYGAYHFGFRGRLMSLGGMGFWEQHSKLVEFLPESGEWEWLPCASGPAHVRAAGCWLAGNGEQLWAVEEPMEGATDGGGVWTLDLTSLRWTQSGRLSDTFSAFHPGSNAHTLETEDHVVWVRNLQSVIIRKADGKAVLSSAWAAKDLQRFRPKGQDVRLLLVSGNEITWMWPHEAVGEDSTAVWDVAAEFEAASEYMDPMNLTEPLEAVDKGAEAQATLALPLWPIVALLALVVGAGAGVAMGRRSGASPSAVESQEGQAALTHSPASKSGKGGLDAEASRVIGEVATLESMGMLVMSSHELNLHLNMRENVSAESRRARRAQFIRDVNREYQARHGVDLIFRERDEHDRRRTNYVIRPHSWPA